LKKKKVTKQKQSTVAAYEGSYLVEATNKTTAQKKISALDNKAPDNILLMPVKKQVGRRYERPTQSRGPRITKKMPRIR
jgi:hypothetical protein